WVDGSTFKMRVFPLEGRKEKRLLLSYTQRLPSLYGVARYRFPGGHNMEHVKEWSFAARVRHGADLRCTSESHPALTFTRQGPDRLGAAAERSVKADQAVPLEVYEQPGNLPAADTARFSAFTQDGHQYLLVRYLPKLASKARRERRDWVFLFES